MSKTKEPSVSLFSTGFEDDCNIRYFAYTQCILYGVHVEMYVDISSLATLYCPISVGKS